MKRLSRLHSKIPLLNRVPGPILFFYGMDLMLGCAYLVIVASGCQLETLNNFLNLEREANLPTWYSSIQLFIVAAFLGVFACWNTRSNQPFSWILPLLPLLMLVLSIDESTEIHEWMGYKSDSLLPGGDRRNTPFYYTGIWMFLIGIPFLIGFTSLLTALRRYFHPTPGAQAKILIGSLILVGGATGVETAANFIPLKTWLFYSEVFLEEVLEMVGATTMLWGAYCLLKENRFTMQMTAVDIQASTRMADGIIPGQEIPIDMAPNRSGVGPDHG